jgi:hypothetical protein
MVGIGVLGPGHDLLTKKGQQRIALILQGLCNFRIHGCLAGTLLLMFVDIHGQGVDHGTLFVRKSFHNIAKAGCLGRHFPDTGSHPCPFLCDLPQQFLDGKLEAGNGLGRVLLEQSQFLVEKRSKEQKSFDLS